MRIEEPLLLIIASQELLTNLLSAKLKNGDFIKSCNSKIILTIQLALKIYLENFF